MIGGGLNLSLTLVMWKFNLILILTLIIPIIYFVFIPYFLSGATIGKKIFSICVIRQNGEKLSFKILFKREFFISILASFSIILIIIIANSTHYYNTNILVYEKSNHINLYYLIQWFYLFNSLCILTFALILLFSKSHTGIQDLIAKTFVINTKQIIQTNAQLESKKEMRTLIMDSSAIDIDGEK